MTLMDNIRAVLSFFSSCFCCCFGRYLECFRRRQLEQMNIDGVAKYLATCKNVIVMTGAGISTNANIPDFRSESFGLYNRLAKFNLPHPTAVFTLDYFKQNPKPFYSIAHDLYPVMDVAKPTLTHYFIKLLDDKGVLLKHYTQNIDGLEDLTDLDRSKTIQAHGHIRTGTCLVCNKSFTFDYMKEFVLKDEIPICDKCSGTVKPDVVLFGESLPSDFWKHLIDFPKCDLLIIIGTSLQVYPFAYLASRVGFNCPRLLINRDPVGEPDMLGSGLTTMLGINPNFNMNSNNKRDVFYRGDCDDGCLALAEALGWQDNLKSLIERGNQKIDETKKKK